MISRRLYRGTAAVVFATLLLNACDVAQQTTQQQPDRQSAPQQGGTKQAPAPQGEPAASRATQQGGVRGLSDQQIGSGGVAVAQTKPTAVPAGDQNLVTDYERTVNNVYERNIGSLVNISDGRITGSGFVIDDQGHIITNNHVAGQLQDIGVTFADESFGKAKLIGTFTEGDIAVIKVDRLPNGVHPVELGDSGALKVGQITVAMGSPLGLERTVTTGIVSALNRSISDISRTQDQTTTDSSLQGLIQTDAAINPGNSGGPLFDSRGQVIGMNTLIATRSASSDTAGSIGLGFAVPINRIKRVAKQIIEKGQYQRPKLGVTVAPVLPQIANQLNLPVRSGVMVAEATGQQAQQAGLHGATQSVKLSNGTQYPVDGDVIIAINNTPVRTLGDLRNVLETQADPGTTVTITFLRAGKEQTTKLTLQ
ncbi:MAG: trypsin-like peptidase domain-containing protein [Herpetosiphon sp.]